MFEKSSEKIGNLFFKHSITKGIKEDFTPFTRFSTFRLFPLELSQVKRLYKPSAFGI